LREWLGPLLRRYQAHVAEYEPDVDAFAARVATPSVAWNWRTWFGTSLFRVLSLLLDRRIVVLASSGGDLHNFPPGRGRYRVGQYRALPGPEAHVDDACDIVLLFDGAHYNALLAGLGARACVCVCVYVCPSRCCVTEEDYGVAHPPPTDFRHMNYEPPRQKVSAEEHTEPHADRAVGCGVWVCARAGRASCGATGRRTSGDGSSSSGSWRSSGRGRGRDSGREVVSIAEALRSGASEGC
jgi:hypothetical protein